MKLTTRSTWKQVLATVGIALNVVFLTVLLLFLVAGCTAILGPRLPHPPRGKYTLEQAQRYAERMNSVQVRNQGYRQVKP